MQPVRCTNTRPILPNTYLCGAINAEIDIVGRGSTSFSEGVVVPPALRDGTLRPLIYLHLSLKVRILVGQAICYAAIKVCQVDSKYV